VLIALYEYETPFDYCVLDNPTAMSELNFDLAPKEVSLRQRR
jgi:hypothetical protein